MKKKKKEPNSRGLYEVKKPVTDPVTGKKVYKSFTSKKSEAEALKKWEDYKINAALKANRLIIERENITFGELVALCLKLKRGTIKDSSWKNTWEIPANKHFVPYFGHETLVRNIKKSDIAMYFKSKADKYATKTLETHFKALKFIFDTAVENDYIEKSPCSKFTVKEGKKKKERRVYTEEQAELVLEYCKLHKYGYEINLLLSYGMSRSELMALKVEDIDFEAKTVRIDEGLTIQYRSEKNYEVIVSEPKTKYRKRLVPVTDETLELIKKSQEVMPAEFIVHDDSGNVMSPEQWTKKHYKVFMCDMHDFYITQGIDVPQLNPHELRHTRATLWVNSGKNLFAIAEVMGWTDLEMLRKVYAHPDIKSLRELVDL